MPEKISPDRYARRLITGIARLDAEDRAITEVDSPLIQPIRDAVETLTVDLYTHCDTHNLQALLALWEARRTF